MNFRTFWWRAPPASVTSFGCFWCRTLAVFFNVILEFPESPINDDVRWNWTLCPTFCLRDESAVWKSSSSCMSKCGAFMTGCFSPPLSLQALVSQPVLSDAEVINETFASYYSNKAPC